MNKYSVVGARFFNAKMIFQKCNITMVITILTLTAPNLISAWDAPQTLLGSLHCSPDRPILAVFKEPVSKGMKGKEEKIGSEGGKNGGRGP